MTTRPVTGGTREPGDLADPIARIVDKYLRAAGQPSDYAWYSAQEAAAEVRALPEVAELIADAARWWALDRPGPDYDGDDADLLLDV